MTDRYGGRWAPRAIPGDTITIETTDRALNDQGITHPSGDGRLAA